MFSARLPCKTSCFQVRLWVTPICARSVVCRLRWHIRVDCVMLFGYRSAIIWNLSTNILIDFPFCFIARRVGKDTSVSSLKSFSRSTHFSIELAWSFMNHSKNPLRVPMNKWAMMASFDTTFKFDICSMLVRRTFAVESVQIRCLEPERIGS